MGQKFETLSERLIEAENDGEKRPASPGSRKMPRKNGPRKAAKGGKAPQGRQKRR